MRSEFKLLEGRRILAVDDAPQITHLLTEVFGACGAEVTAANDGLQAMALVGTQDYDLVVLDLGMPAPNGRDVLDYIRLARPAVLDRCILLTAHRYDPDTLESLQRLAVPVMFKPFQLDSLREKACHVLQQRSYVA